MPWFEGAEFTNPPGAQVLVDSGPIFAGTFDVLVAAQNSKAVTVTIERRNAANTTTVQSRRVRLGTGFEEANLLAIVLGSGERVRVVNDSGFTGVIEVDLFMAARPPLQAMQ